VIWRADYKPFGEKQSVTATVPNDKRFIGKEKDEETGLSYFGARYENAKIGRFISPDPERAVDPKTSKTNEDMLLNPQRLNTYAYALNNPYRFVDSSGEFTEVIVSDSRMISKGSQFGHVAININGTVYSRAHSQWSVQYASEYIKTQETFRDSIGLVLNTTPEEEKVMSQFLTEKISKNEKYDLSTNSCSSNVADALYQIGINVYGPWEFGGIAPVDVLRNLPKSNRVIERNWYGKKTDNTSQPKKQTTPQTK